MMMMMMMTPHRSYAVRSDLAQQVNINAEISHFYHVFSS